MGKRSTIARRMTSEANSIYGGRDPRDLPTYTLREAARYLRIPRSTLCQWTSRNQPSPLIKIPDGDPPMLTFWNVVEAYVLAVIRRRFKISLGNTRSAIKYVEKELNTKRPLINEQFKANGIHLFVEKLGHLINVSQHGQLADGTVMRDALDRIGYDADGISQIIYPWFYDTKETKHVEINPKRAFGRLVIINTRVPTDTIARRWEAGDDTDNLAKDYDIPVESIEDALRWEHAARKAA